MSTQKHCTISVAFKGFFFVTRIKIFMFAVQLKACLNQLNKAHDWSYHHAINLYMLDCSQCFPKSKLKQNGLSATMIYNLNLRQPQQNISKLCHVIKLIGHGRAKTWKDTQLHRNSLIMRHTVFLVCEVNQWVTLFDDLLGTYSEKDNRLEKTC